MAKYRCPACGMLMRVQIAGGKYLISCTCGIVYYARRKGGANAAFLEFLHKFDTDKNSVMPGRPGQRGPSSMFGAGRMRPAAAPHAPHKKAPLPPPPPNAPPAAAAPHARPKSEIDAMMQDKDPDNLVRDIMSTEKHYVCAYVVSDSPGPAMGSSPGDLGINPNLEKYLKGAGISRLYRFQQESYHSIIRGTDTVIAAPTASGKTESFLIPVVQMALEAGGPMFALIVYPTKALARDQHLKIGRMAASVGVKTAVFDGDTPQKVRNAILESPPHILVTNFDVIHYHLPRRTRLASLLHLARILVIDEVHTYSGIFGSNVHHLVRRLDRVCRSRLQMVAASATISEPVAFCSALLGRDVSLVETKQRRGRVDTIMLSARQGGLHEMMLDVTNKLLSKRHKTLVFGNSHRSAEMLSLAAKRAGIDIRVHRSGLPMRMRHKIEDAFKSGSLMAISCTPTLELGIDIGAVDGVVSALVPVNRLLQRVGRAARRGQRGYAILALGNDPISQYYENRPEDYFEDSEMSYIDPTNPIVQEYHMAAMSCDAPLCMNQVPAEHRAAVQRCADGGLVQNRNGMIVPQRDRIYGLLQEHSLRGMGENIRIVGDGKILGDRALPVALTELYPGATYYVGGKPYVVKDLNLGARHATLRAVGLYHHNTRPQHHTIPTLMRMHDTKTMWDTQIAHCTLKIRQIVTGYTSKDSNGSEVHTTLESPPAYDFVTKGLVFCAPILDVPGKDGEAGTYHAAEHAIIEGGNMIIGGASQDMGGVSLGDSGAIFVYDGAIGGNGATRALYDKIEEVVRRSAQILQQCPCMTSSGCPRCTYSYRCGNNNNPLHKRGALRALESIMGGDPGRLDNLPNTE